MTGKWRLLLVTGIILGVAAFGLSLVSVGGGDDVGAVTRLDVPEVNMEQYTQATGSYDWQFPQDFGPHPDYLTEWWYYTGNLATDDGRRFGYQFTVFRRAITPTAPDDTATSEWRTNQVYLAHFTISDIETGTFYHEERFSRGGAGLAGAQGVPYRVWLEDWEIRAQNDDASRVTIQAVAENFALDVTLEQLKPPALQGDGGLSPKSDDPGNASYYYTLTRQDTQGTLTLDGNTFEVSGLTWKDHEFSTSALGEDALGWDWFGLIFEDNTEMMVGQIRLEDGGIEPAFGGLMMYPDNTTEYLPSDSFTITALDTWTSPHTGADYPSGWEINVQTDRGNYIIEVQPLMNDQELYDTDPAYWEGAVRVTGDFTGYGYAELTGYVQSMRNRF
jgi:predicted secreted hydrolase